MKPFEHTGTAKPKRYHITNVLLSCVSGVIVGFPVYGLAKSLWQLSTGMGLVVGGVAALVTMAIRARSEVVYKSIDFAADHMVIHYQKAEQMRVPYSDIEAIKQPAVGSIIKAMLILKGDYPFYQVPLYRLEGDMDSKLRSHLESNGVARSL